MTGGTRRVGAVLNKLPMAAGGCFLFAFSSVATVALC
jgi:hypothetical protein